ncbi:MAG: CaiB/BaiF CoA transferase family protein [Acidimicrobiales bacterium]
MVVPHPPQALADVRVLEIANWVAGPSAGAILADLGAEVVKVEPLAGDSMRGKLRQPSKRAGVPGALVAADVPFHLDNRGKRSIAVDLADHRGADVVQRLAGQSDVVLTNLLPHRLERYGLGPDQLRGADPRLVYAVVTGHGSRGPEADRTGFDLTTFFGRGGVGSLVGEPGEPPPAFRPGQGDHPTGLALCAGILAALRVRDRTGEGQVVETSLLRTAAWTIGCDVAVALVDRSQPRTRARTEPISPLNTRYRCGDGVWITLSAQDQSAWPRFCQAVGRPDLGEDPRFATVADRFHHATELVAGLDAVFAGRAAKEWAGALDESGVVWAATAELPDLVGDPQARANEMFVEVEDPRAGRFETLAAPFTLSATPLAVDGPGPAVGQHTRAVLATLGMDDGEIAGLVDLGIVGDGGPAAELSVDGSAPPSSATPPARPS